MWKRFIPHVSALCFLLNIVWLARFHSGDGGFAPVDLFATKAQVREKLILELNELQVSTDSETTVTRDSKRHKEIIKNVNSTLNSDQNNISTREKNQNVQDSLKFHQRRVQKKIIFKVDEDRRAINSKSAVIRDNKRQSEVINENNNSPNFTTNIISKHQENTRMPQEDSDSQGPTKFPSSETKKLQLAAFTGFLNHSQAQISNTGNIPRNDYLSASKVVGWLYNSNSNDTIYMQISVYINELILFPIFDGIVSYSVSEVLVDGNSTTPSSFWAWNDTSNCITLNTRKYVDDGILSQKLRVDFGGDYYPYFLDIRFDQLDYELDLNEWEYENEVLDNRTWFRKVDIVKHKRYNVLCVLKKRELNDRFEIEYGIMKSLRKYTSIIDVYGWASVGERFRGTRDVRSEAYMLMERMDGTSTAIFSEIWKSQRKKLAPLYLKYENLAREAAKGFLEALRDLHEGGYTHYDIKKENLLYKNVAGGRIWKLIDFEFSRTLRKASGKYRKHQGIANTWVYAAPEMMQFEILKDRGERYGPDIYHDGRADIYAAGAVIFNLLSRKHPWDGPEYYENQYSMDQFDRVQQYWKYMKMYRDIGNCSYCYENVHITDEAKDFLNHMMKWDVNERFTIAEALQHPFTRYAADSISLT